MSAKYGKNHDEVAEFIEAIKKLTPKQIKKYAAATNDAAAYAAAYTAATYAAYTAATYAATDADATDAATDAAADAADAAYDAAAWRCRWYFARAARALAIKHLVGKHGFTQTHYDLLTKVVRDMKANSEPETNSALVLYRMKLQAALDHALATQRAEFAEKVRGLEVTDVLRMDKYRLTTHGEGNWMVAYKKEVLSLIEGEK